MRSFSLTLCACGLALAAVATVSRPAKAEEQFNVTIRNKYVTREGAMGYDGAVLHSQYMHRANSGFTFGVWHAMSLDPLTLNGNGADELRVFLGRGVKKQSYALDFGLQYEDRYRLFSLRSGDMLTAYGEGSIFATKSDQSDLTPFARVEGHMPLHASGERPSFLGVAGLTLRGRPEKESLINILIRPAFIYDSGGQKGGGYGMLGSLDLALNWQFCKQVEMSLPELRIIKPIKVHDDRTEQQILGGMLTLTF